MHFTTLCRRLQPDFVYSFDKKFSKFSKTGTRPDCNIGNYFLEPVGSFTIDVSFSMLPGMCPFPFQELKDLCVPWIPIQS